MCAIVDPDDGLVYGPPFLKSLDRKVVSGCQEDRNSIKSRGQVLTPPGVRVCQGVSATPEATQQMGPSSFDKGMVRRPGWMGGCPPRFEWTTAWDANN